MASIPVPRSWNTILGDMIAGFLSRFGLKSLKVGSPVLSILESAAQSDLRTSQDIFTLLNSNSIDRATGQALDRIGADERVPRIGQSPSSGLVDISDSSFTKISSKVYQGKPAPIVGTTTLYVADASLFPVSGNVYIGRGTSNYEGPIPYSAKTNAGTYWTLTLTQATQLFHNLGEGVIVAQGGNRAVPAGSLVQTPQGNSGTAIQFATLFTATIPDGETGISSVRVVAQTSGVATNVIAGAINSFVSAPFTGATVTNALPFSNGKATESDDSYRERIRQARQSRTKGTALAIKSGVRGIESSDDNSRVTSASLVAYTGLPSILYVDDGTGYEEKASGAALETLIDSASGGEVDFQVSQRPISKASLISLNSAPFALASGEILAVQVGGAIYQHTFNADEFRDISNATAYEVVASINADTKLGFYAATANNGMSIRIFGRTDTLEDIQVVSPVSGNDANPTLLFSTSRVDTLRLYKNDRLLNKDGLIASVVSNPFSLWGTLVSGVTLILAVDGTPAVTYTFVDQDFINAGYAAVGKNSVDAWVSVINAKIAGVTASNSNGLLKIVSNAGASATAKISITGGSLVSPGQMFSAQTVSGKPNDYVLNRNTGQGRLIVPLAVGDHLSAGTLSTRAFIESTKLGTTTIASGGNLWFAVDGSAQLISTGLSPAVTLTYSVPRVETWGYRERITASSSIFSNVQAGDWLLAWDTSVASLNRGTFRIDQATGTTLDIPRKSMVTGRAYHQATALLDGRVMVTGGISYNGDATGANGVVLSNCEIYDPTTGLWTAAASMANARYHHSAHLLASGKILVCGGLNDNLPGGSPAAIDAQTLSSCEIYDPAANTWTAAAAMPVATYQAAATRLSSPSEKVVIAGGANTSGGVLQVLANTQLYDPGTNTWSAGAAMSTGLWRAASTSISTGKLLVVGGSSSGLTYTNSVQTYDLGTNTWVNDANWPVTGYGARAVNMGADVLVCGGATNLFPQGTAGSWTWNIAGNAWTTQGSMAVRRMNHTLTMASAVPIVAFGEGTGGNSQINAETYSAGVWTITSAPLSAFGRSGARAIADPTTGDLLVTGGVDISLNSSGGCSQASCEMYNVGGDLWHTTIDSALGPVTLSAQGMAVVRGTGVIQKISVPAATYTANDFATSIAGQIVGASASVYQTSALRVQTNSFTSGDIALVAADSDGLKLGMTPASATADVGSHLASIVSANSQLGTPEFTSPTLLAAESSTSLTLHTNVQQLKANSLLVSLRSFDDVYNSATPIYHRGNDRRLSWLLSSLVNGTKTQKVGLRSSTLEATFMDRFYAASPYAIGPQDDFTVVVDGDTTTKRYSPPLYRKLVPASGTYGITNAFKDADNSNSSLAVAFGLNQSFNDYAVYMASRALLFSADATRQSLIRYKKLGPDGDKARVRFGYPSAASQALAVSTNSLGSKFTDVTISLPSGALRAGYSIRNSTYIGLATSAGTNGFTNVALLSGFTVTNAARAGFLNYTGISGGGSFTNGETVTGGTSGATAVVVATPTAGTIQITSIVGTFINGETITGSTSAKTATTAGSQYFTVTLTLSLPSGAVAISDCGFTVGQNLYVNSTSGSFPSGIKVLSAKTATTVSYLESGALTSAVNIGDVSYDSAPASFTTGASPVVVGDIVSPLAGSTLAAQGYNQPFRISTLLTAQTIMGHMTSAPTGSTVVTWVPLTNASNLRIYPIDTTANTMGQMVTAINALGSTCSIRATLLSDGTGAVVQSSDDLAAAAPTWNTLTDGVNYVQSTSAPGSMAGDYSLTFKNAITAGLATGSDWANEDVSLVPITTSNLVNWLNLLAVTGLSNVAEISASGQGQSLQLASLTAGSSGSIQVQGGSANSATAAIFGAASLVTDLDTSTYAVATILSSDAAALFSGAWVVCANTSALPKNVITANTTLTTWASDGTITLDSTANTPLYTQLTTQAHTTWLIEKQGKFVCYTFDHSKSPNVALPVLSAVSENDWVRVTPAAVSTPNAVAISAGNQGIFRVVRVDYTSNNLVRAFWIENPNAIEEYSESDLFFYSHDSVMPGDQLVINTSLWGANNIGTWTVAQVGGTAFANTTADRHIMKVTGHTPQVISSTPGALGANSTLIQVIESQPARLIKRIRAMAPNQTNGSYTDVKFETSAGYKLMTEAAGSVLSALDKLGFDVGVAQGVDGYRYNTGLIGEANKVVYGDQTDTATYPGIAAEGSRIDIQSPLVKRIQVALSIRVRSKIGQKDIVDRVKSAVASAINAVGIGEDIAISDIVDAASKVSGVVAVSIISPAYSSVEDLIVVNANEKPLILNLDQDITVSIVS